MSAFVAVHGQRFVPALAALPVSGHFRIGDNATETEIVLAPAR